MNEISHSFGGTDVNVTKTISEKCPICSNGTISKIKVNETFTYKKQRMVIPNYEVFKCQNCGEDFIDEEYLKKIESQFIQFKKSVDYRIVKKCKWFVVEKRVEETTGFWFWKKTKISWIPCNVNCVPINVQSDQGYYHSVHYFNSTCEALKSIQNSKH